MRVCSTNDIELFSLQSNIYKSSKLNRLLLETGMTLKAHSQANGMFLFYLCYIFLSVWMREGNIPMNYNF